MNGAPREDIQMRAPTNGGARLAVTPPILAWATEASERKYVDEVISFERILNMEAFERVYSTTAPQPFLNGRPDMTRPTFALGQPRVLCVPGSPPTRPPSRLVSDS